MEAWRICAARYASDPLDGVGAYLYGGRWNSPGVHLAYCARSRALAILEVRVHTDSGTAPLDHLMVPVQIADELVATLDPATLPSGWRRYPAPAPLASFGDDWVRSGESLGLLVPSSVVPAESNLLINPRHPDFGQVQVGEPTPVQYDARLFV